MASLKIYVVTGRTGQYEDRHEWNVRAYFTHNAATREVLRLNDVLEAHGLRWNEPTLGPENYTARSERAKKEIKDENFHSDYNGVMFHIEELELAPEV